MKIVRCLGGLGNQMFQYAFYKSLKQKFKNVKFDLNAFEDYRLHNGYELKRVFNIETPEASQFIVNVYDPENKKWLYRKLRKLLKLRNAYYQETALFTYDKNIFEDSSSKLYWGYWQNPKYFEQMRKKLLKDFTFQLPLNNKNVQMLSDIKSRNSVALHVRRGDYLSSESLGGVCKLDYFTDAVDFMTDKVSNPDFYVFSDDIAWCKENLNLKSATYLDWNSGAESAIDMQLMSNCKHNIISNSSFSWWGAWLNTNDQKIVIAPKNWINDHTIDATGVTPDDWIKL